MERKVSEIGGYRFLGWGPAATGATLDWAMHPDMFGRCSRCNDLVSLDPHLDETCRCGRLTKDSGRFGSVDGDESIAIYTNRS
ncbi:hypothetical protein C8K30_101333 [Promicromonospora sp. AC04]|uniref:hypothetical protein n=1 Tax=Promicromonospora sp. AC04 TaxID=2135723 RepID=UPI000D3D8451|nr:hypothetical protein [Promicromonospora sp. AC04]PUB31816.1 hypothetical protein C8K30_101333 [Promicromonospora sp. AC04]